MEPVAPAPRAPRALRFVGPVRTAIVVLVAVWALIFQLRLPGRLPEERDYVALSEALSKEAHPGDVLVVYPWWADRARAHLPESLPIVGYLGYEKDGLLRHPRIWLLAQPNLPKSDLDGFLDTFGAGRSRVGEPRAFGNLQLSLWENGRHRPISFWAPDALDGAQVYLEAPDGQRTPCPPQGDRFQCPGPPYLYARTEWHEIFYQPRRCIWMHPPGGAAKMVAEFPGAASTASEGLLEAGFVWDTWAYKGRANTTVTVAVESGEGQRLADIALTPGMQGMQRVTFVPPQDHSGAAALRISVQSEGTDHRWVCVDALAFSGGAK